MSDQEQTVESFGGWPTWNRSLPARHWIRSHGGWCSHNRKRCTDDCDIEIKPADGSDPDASEEESCQK